MCFGGKRIRLSFFYYHGGKLTVHVIFQERFDTCISENIKRKSLSRSNPILQYSFKILYLHICIIHLALRPIDLPNSSDCNCALRNKKNILLLNREGLWRYFVKNTLWVFKNTIFSINRLSSYDLHIEY